MNISHYPSDDNRASIFADHGANQLKYLEPDYFLPSSRDESYYSRKYSGRVNYHNLNFKSKFCKISRVASVMLLSLSFLATALEVKAHPIVAPNPSFLFGKDSAGISTNIPIPPIMPQSPPPAPPLPPVLPAMPEFVSDAGIGGKSDNRSALFESIRNFGKGVLRKVKREPKPIVVSSDGGDLMSQLYDTLERRRSGISGEKKDNKFKKAAKQVIALTAEEQKAREAEIAKKIAENKEKAATLRKQKGPEWEANRKKILAEVEVDNQRRAAEAAKAMREQKARERGENREGVIMGIDPILHNNMVADLRQEISSLKEQLILKGNVTAGVINDLDLNDQARSKRSLEDIRIVETKDQSTSTEDLIVLEDRLYDEKLEHWGFEEEEAVKKLDEVISTYSASDSGYDDEILSEDSSDTSSIRSSDINSMGSEVVLQSKPIVSDIVQDELLDIEQELQSQQLKEEEAVEAVEDILKQDVITDTGERAAANSSTVGHQAVLKLKVNL